MKRAWMSVAMGLVLGAAAAQAGPKAALFVQNRAGASMEGQIDAFGDLVGARLAEAGFEVIRAQDVLARFAESRSAEESQQLRQAVEALQTLKSEGTVDGAPQEASALRIAQAMEADYLVFASMLSMGENRVNVQAYGTAQQAKTTTLRLALRVLDGGRGSQIHGDVVAVSEKILENANLQVDAGDQLNSLLDRGAGELAERVRGSVAKIEAAKPEAPALASVTVRSTVEGAAVEVDGVVVGTAPGTFRIRPGIHEVRVTREGYATWEKSVAFSGGQILDVAMELSAAGLARKGELEAQAIAREQSAADAQATTTVAGGIGQQASNSYIRLEGMPGESLSIGDSGDRDEGTINVIQQQ